MNYFRITGYYPKNDFCFIIDSNGMFEKLWQFSAYLVQKGFDIIEASKEENMIDCNIEKVKYDTEHIFLRASGFGKPKTTTKTIDGNTYKAIQIADKVYVPNNYIVQ